MEDELMDIVELIDWMERVLPPLVDDAPGAVLVGFQWHRMYLHPVGMVHEVNLQYRTREHVDAVAAVLGLTDQFLTGDVNSPSVKYVGMYDGFSVVVFGPAQ
jgi:hypothetical protein